MRRFRIKRIALNSFGTFGVLMEEINSDFIPFCLTIERKWLGNRVGESCIPDGTYMCKRGQFTRHGNTFEVMNVPGRTAILFHKGNIDDDSHGCIILGEQYGYLNEDVAVLASGPAFSEFLRRLDGINEFQLTIITV